MHDEVDEVSVVCDSQGWFSKKIDFKGKNQYDISVKALRLVLLRERSPIVAAPPPSGSDDGVASGAGCFPGTRSIP